LVGLSPSFELEYPYIFFNYPAGWLPQAQSFGIDFVLAAPHRPVFPPQGAAVDEIPQYLK